MADAVKLIEELAKKALERSKEQREQREQREREEQQAGIKTQNVLPFPVWPDPRRAAPSAAFRSALFPAIGRQKRRKLWDEPIYSVKGVTVIFRGEQFDQSDLDVFLEIIHQMRDNPTEAEFTAHGLLKALGRATGKKNYEWLHTVIIRLTAGTVDMTDHQRRYFGHLIDGGERDEGTKKYVLSINPKVAEMFRAAWSSLDINQRRSLKSDTAKALHAYYSSHVNPGFHRFETLAGIVGIVGKNRNATIRKAHQELEEAGFLLAWDATKEGVSVQAILTPGQVRAITRQISKTPRKPHDPHSV